MALPTPERVQLFPTLWADAVGLISGFLSLIVQLPFKLLFSHCAPRLPSVWYHFSDIPSCCRSPRRGGVPVITMSPSASILCVLPLWSTAEKLSRRPSVCPWDELLCVWVQVQCVRGQRLSSGSSYAAVLDSQYFKCFKYFKFCFCNSPVIWVREKTPFSSVIPQSLKHYVNVD